MHKSDLHQKDKIMETAKLKIEKNQQIVILPDNYFLEGNEVYLKKMGNAIILISKENPYQCLWDSLDLFSEYFMENREQLPLQEREDLFE